MAKGGRRHTVSTGLGGGVGGCKWRGSTLGLGDTQRGEGLARGRGSGALTPVESPWVEAGDLGCPLLPKNLLCDPGWAQASLSLQCLAGKMKNANSGNFY